MANGNGTVWKIATGALLVFLAATAAMWGMVTVHAEHPHEGSLPRTEFELTHRAIDQRLERIETKIDEVLAR